MNACIRSVVRTGLSRGMEVFGVRRGYTGLMRGDLMKMDRRSVSNIIHRGGTILESSRCPEFHTGEGRAKAYEVMKEHGIEGLVAIGGNGTFQGAAAMVQETNAAVLGIPGTIDNDIYGTDRTLGFDTAVNTALDAIDKIRDTATSMEYCFLVEVMGRHSGFIALEVALAGGAEGVLVPEVQRDDRKLLQMICSDIKRGKRTLLIVVAEGDQAGGAFKMAEKIKKTVGIDARVCVLGHIQRGGSPTAADRILGSCLGAAAVDGLLEGRGGKAVGEVKGEIVYTPLREACEKKKALNGSLMKILETLTR